MTCKVATFEARGANALITFVDEEGFIAQVILNPAELERLRSLVDAHLWNQERVEVLKLGTKTRVIDLKEVEAQEPIEMRDSWQS